MQKNNVVLIQMKWHQAGKNGGSYKISGFKPDIVVYEKMVVDMHFSNYENIMDFAQILLFHLDVERIGL